MIRRGRGNLFALDRKSLKILGKVALGGPGDDIEVDTKRNQVYVCNDDGTLDWVFNGSNLKLVAASRSKRLRNSSSTTR